MSFLKKSESNSEANLLARSDDGTRTTRLEQSLLTPTLQITMVQNQQKLNLSGVTNEWAIFENRYLKGIQSYNKDTELEGPGKGSLYCAITWHGVIYCGTEDGLWKRENNRWVRAFNSILHVRKLVSWSSLLAIKTDTKVYVVTSADGVQDFLEKSVKFGNPVEVTAWLHGIVVVWTHPNGSRVLSVVNHALTNFHLPFLGTGSGSNLAGSTGSIKLWTTYNSVYFVSNTSVVHRVTWRGNNQNGTLRLKHRRVVKGFFQGASDLVQWDDNFVKVVSSRNKLEYFSSKDRQVYVLWETPQNLQVDSFGSYLSEETQCNEETLYATTGKTVYCWHVDLTPPSDSVPVPDDGAPPLPPLDGFVWKENPNPKHHTPVTSPALPAAPDARLPPALHQTQPPPVPPPATPAPKTSTPSAPNRGPPPPLPPRPVPQVPQQPPKCPAAAKRQARQVNFTEEEDPLLAKLLARRESLEDIADDEAEEEYEDEY